MDGGRYGLALVAGMLATVNPCGLPMLPAYLTFFISGDDGRTRTDLAAVLRALGVAGAVSLGFVAVFGILGEVVDRVTHDVYRVTPWISVVVGLVLVVVGVALLAGKQVTVALPKLDRGGRTGGLGSMFVFGVSYAIASVSCTLPVFMSIVFTSRGGFGIFLTYSAGMTVVLMALTVSLALARTELVNALRRSLRVINRVAGGFLVIAGLYVSWYSLYEIRDRSDSDPAVDRVTSWSSGLSNRITDIGATRLAGVLVLLIVAVGAVAYVRSQRRPADDRSGPSEPSIR